MRMFLFSSDADTLTGLRLAGIDGVLIDCAEALDAAARDVCAREDVGILLVTRTLALRYPEAIFDLKRRDRPLVSEIPDMEHPTAESASIRDYIRDAIGS